MMFVTIMTMMGVISSALFGENWCLFSLIPFLFAVMDENDKLKDRIWFLEQKLTRNNEDD